MCVSLFFSTLVCFYYHSLVLDQNKLWQKQALYKFQLQNLLHCLPRITRHLNLQKPIHGNTHTHTQVLLPLSLSRTSFSLLSFSAPFFHSFFHSFTLLLHKPKHPSIILFSTSITTTQTPTNGHNNPTHINSTQKQTTGNQIQRKPPPIGQANRKL